MFIKMIYNKIISKNVFADGTSRRWAEQHRILFEF